MADYRILVVDDEQTLCEILQFNLEVDGYTVDVAYSAEEALELDLSVYSLILLDVMMGAMSGFKMAQILKGRQETAHIPIIFCTAKDTEEDTIVGLNIGADDYISKPFSTREVLARVKTVLRRTAKQGDKSNNVEFEQLQINLLNKVCKIAGKKIDLTKNEFELLLLLINHQGTIFSREDILQRVWSDQVVVLDRSIDVCITRLRQKIRPYGDHIVTRRGYGYGFE